MPKRFDSDFLKKAQSMTIQQLKEETRVVNDHGFRTEHPTRCFVPEP